MSFGAIRAADRGSTWETLVSGHPWCFRDIDFVEQAAERLAQVVALGADAGQELGRLDRVDHGPRRGADQRVGGKGAGVIARLHDRGHLVHGQRRADGQPTAQRLCHRNQVGLDAARLIAPHGARAPHAALDLVADQERSNLVARCPQSL